MRLTKKIMCLAMALCAVFSINAGATDMSYVDHMTTTPPILNEGIRPYGTWPPSGSDIQDLSIDDYPYQVDHIESHLYTSKWLTGASSINATIEDWKVLKYGYGYVDRLSITLIDSKRKEIDSKDITLKAIGTDKYGNAYGWYDDSVSFTGLSSSEKYYLYFSIGGYNNSISFHGTVSKG